MPVPVEYNRRIPKQDIQFDLFDFQFCLPHTEIKDESRELEASFCRDFACCGLILNDLHDLLQHYEECHVRVEEEDFFSQSDSSCSISSSSSISEEEDDIQWTPPSFDNHLKTKSTTYFSEPEDDQVLVGKKRNASTAALSLLTQSAVKKLALVNGQDLPSPILSDEEFLAQAGALLASANNNSNADKPYKCSVKGCDKAYKNPNGLKYHNQHGHCNLLNEDDESITSKPYQCTIGECGKRYKNLNGLKYHIEHSHMAALNQTLASFGSTLLTPASSTPSSPTLSPMLF